MALTQFASSNGGAMAKRRLPLPGGQEGPLRRRHQVPGLEQKITAKAVAKAYPSAGTVRKLQISKRDGSGALGRSGDQIKIIGSKKTVSVSGSAFQSKFGMRSSLYKVTKP